MSHHPHSPSSQRTRTAKRLAPSAVIVPSTAILFADTLSPTFSFASFFAFVIGCLLKEALFGQDALLLARSLLHSRRQAADGFPVTGRQLTTTFTFELPFIVGIFLWGGRFCRADAQISIAVHPYLDLVANF